MKFKINYQKYKLNKRKKIILDLLVTVSKIYQVKLKNH